jgi:hypothetical protein
MARGYRWMLLVALLCVGCGGCAGKVNKTMQSWMGHTVVDLVAAWGPPDAVIPDGKGGRLLIYRRDQSITIPGSATTTGTATRVTDELWRIETRTRTTPDETFTRSRHRTFGVDARGRIYSWSWKGV